MKKLTLILTIVMMLSTLLCVLSFVASAEEASLISDEDPMVIPTKQTFTIAKIPYNPGGWTNDGWDLASGNYPSDPTTVNLADVTAFDDTDYACHTAFCVR